jgi:hypothetical protein
MNDGGLAQELKRGQQITLVLGAGVSRSRGLPLWSKLLRETWKVVNGNDPYAEDIELLEQCKTVCRESGVPAEFIDRLDIRRHPLELQLRFERIFDRLRWSDVEDLQRKLRLSRKHVRDTAKLSGERRAEQLFAEILRRILYRDSQSRSPKWNAKQTDTLSLVAGALLLDAKRPVSGRKIARVITFNVDDLLERMVNSGRSIWRPRVFPVRWSSDTNKFPGKGAIPIYHLHGFVPWDRELYPFYSRDQGIMEVPLPLESLVFNVEQYWRAVGNSGDFASRVFAQALGETCVFLGVSMTDINLLRWLAQHSIEVKRDIQYMTDSWGDSFERVYTQYTELAGHYWITEGSSDWNQRDESEIDADVLKEILSSGRGVQCIHIPSWDSKEFHNWWKSTILSD